MTDSSSAFAQASRNTVQNDREAHENRPFAMLEKLLLEAVARWGEYENVVRRDLIDHSGDVQLPFLRDAKNIAFLNVDRLRLFAEEVAPLFSNTDDRATDTRRLDGLDAMANDGHVAFCFELDGGVHGTYQQAGGETQQIRSKDDVREVLDALLRGEGVTAQPGEGTGHLILEPKDLDILSHIHHAHANALHALKHFKVAPERTPYWEEQFEHFRNFYARAIRSATPEQQKALMVKAEDEEDATWDARVRVAGEALKPYLSAGVPGSRHTLEGYQEGSIVRAVAAAFDGWTPPV